MAYEVQQEINNQWENTWSTFDDVEGEQPTTFDTVEEAQAELDHFFHDINKEILNGNMSVDSGFDYNEFMIVEIPTLEYKRIETIAA